MKKILLVLALVVAVCAVNAQNKVEIGLKTGFNSTKLNLSDVPTGTQLKSEAKAGFLFGAYGKIKLVGDLSFQPEIYYAKKSTEMIANSVPETGDINSWDIPLLANLQLIDLKVARVYGVAGPVASIITESKFTDFDLDKDDYKTANWTFQAGLGVSIWKLTGDVRYEWGLKNISDIKGMSNLGQKTDVLTVTIGYRLFGL